MSCGNPCPNPCSPCCPPVVQYCLPTCSSCVSYSCYPPRCIACPPPCRITICTPPVPCGPCPPKCIPYCPPPCATTCLTRTAMCPVKNPITVPAPPLPQPKYYVPKRPCQRPNCLHKPGPICCFYLHWRLPCKADCFEV